MKCPVCADGFTKPQSAINRAARIGAPIYCGRLCAGIARRNGKSLEQKRAEKREYDMARRKEKACEIKAAKAEYYQRTRDPVKEAVKRKERMPKHIAYCRRPEYRARKQEYDLQYRNKKEFGDFWESAILALEIRRQCLALLDDTEIRRNAGTLNKHQQRRRNYDRTYGNKPEIGSLGNIAGP